MKLSPDRPRSSDVALLLFSIGLLIFVSPARALWADPDRHWLTPFALWLLLILLAIGVSSRRKSHDP